MSSQSREQQTFVPKEHAAAILYRPTDMLRKNAEQTRFDIKESPYFRPLRVDFDMPYHVLDERQREFVTSFTEAARRGGHKPTGTRPEKDKTDLTIGFHAISEGNTPLWDRVEEVDPPRALRAREKYGIDAHKAGYAVAVTLPEKDDIRRLPKREQETLCRRLMANVGSLKLIFLHPQYLAFSTMEGGFGVQEIDELHANDRFLDRLAFHTFAKESGSYTPIPDAISKEDWDKSEAPEFLKLAFRDFGTWGYIDKQFNAEDVASKKRARLINGLLGWSRQSESAGAVFDPRLQIPGNFHMGEVTGGIVSSKTGRDSPTIDKRFLDRSMTTPVAIVPNHRGQMTAGAFTDLNKFERYSLGIAGGPVGWPSIEFDEMARVFYDAPRLRVSLHTSGAGFRPDKDGDFLIPHVLGFMHAHQAVSAVRDTLFHGVSMEQVAEYIPANLERFRYPVGCGKDIQFDATGDAAKRSRGVNEIGSGIQVAFFDAIDHGTNFLALAEPLPGTDLIPFDPLYALRQIVDPVRGGLSLTSEIVMI